MPLKSSAPTDTDAGIQRLLVTLWRELGPAGRLGRAASATAAVNALAWAGARERHETTVAQRRAFADVKLGCQAARLAYSQGLVPVPGAEAWMDHLAVVWLVVRALDACGTPYVVGGSLASSVSGEPRATLDADLMIDLRAPSIQCLIDALGDDFYADGDALARAVRDTSSANIVHRPTATKVDLFIMGATPIEGEQMRRRRAIPLETPPGARLYVYTPEDILLQKLRWFRLGHESSERQWRDIASIFAVQGERLDLEYLREAAAVISVHDLLERAIREREAS